MDIRQLLIPHAGKSDGELQIPMVDADKQSELLELSFGMVFATNEMQPNHKEVLQLGVQRHASAEPVDAKPDLVGKIEPESGRLREAKLLAADVLKRPDQMQAELPEATLLMSVDSNSYAEENVEAGWATDAQASKQPKTETAESSQDPNQHAATLVETFGQSASRADAPEIDWSAPVPLVESRTPTVQGNPANQVPANNAIIPNESPPEVSKSQLASDKPEFTRGNGPRPIEQVDLPLARLDAGIHSPAEPVAEAQTKSVQHALPASGPIKGVSNKLDGASPRWSTEMQVETGRPTLESSIASSNHGTPKFARPLMLTPASDTVEQLQSLSKTVEDLVSKDTIASASEETGQTAARIVESRSNGTEFVPVSTQAAAYPVGTAPLVQILESESERQSFDEAGFRTVEQISPTTGDLKTSVLARSAEPLRITLAQIADVVRQQPDRPVELTLSPEELGRLRMSFQSEGSAMHVTLSFERPDTLDLMRRHIDQLAQDLRAFGMSEVTFSFQQQTSDGGGGAFPNGGTAGSSNEQHSDPRAASDDVAPIVLNIARGAGVDIRV